MWRSVLQCGATCATMDARRGIVSQCVLKCVLQCVL